MPTSIALQTALGTDIENEQGTEISAFERNWSVRLAQDHPNAKFRTGLSPTYNCHGLTFASRRTRIWDVSLIQLILREDLFEEIKEQHHVLPGDIVIYRDYNGDATHSGIVADNVGPLFIPRVVSKWGSGPETFHALHDVPPVYGANHQFFRCRA
jgi:hypothetical protein